MKTFSPLETLFAQCGQHPFDTYSVAAYHWKTRVIGVSSPGSATYLFLNYLLHRHGLIVEHVKIASIGLGALSMAAFTQGRVDAAVLAASAITTIKRRFPRIVLLADARTAAGVKQTYDLRVELES